MKHMLSHLRAKKTDRFHMLVKQLTARYDLELLVLFGSHATGTTWQGSDIDIGYLTTRRLHQTEVQQLILDIARYTQIDQVHAIDLYVDSTERLQELQKGRHTKYMKEPTIVQYNIATHGTLLYQKKSGVFRQYKQRLLSHPKFDGLDVHSSVVHEKLTDLSNKLAVLGEHETFVSTLRLAISDGQIQVSDQSVSKSHDLLASIAYEAMTHEALSIVDTAVRLNKYILNNAFNTNITTTYDSFITLAEHSNLSESDTQTMTELAHTVMLKNFLTADYFYGPTWSVREMIELIKRLYPKYISIIQNMYTNIHL